MTNHNPSVQSQFMAALLAFTMLAYANVWLLKDGLVFLETEDKNDFEITHADDFEKLNNEEKFQFLNSLVENQWAGSRTDGYFANVAQTPSNLSASLQGGSLTVFSAPISQLQCDTPTVIVNNLGGYSHYGARGVDFIGAPRLPGQTQQPVPRTPRDQAAEFYVPSIRWSPNSFALEVWHLGNMAMSLPTTASLLSTYNFPTVLRNAPAVNDRLMTYVLERMQPSNPSNVTSRVLQTRHTGPDGIFGSSDDPPPVTIFDDAGTAFEILSNFTNYPIDISGHYLIFGLRLRSGPGPRAEIIIRVKLSQDGRPLLFDSPSLQSPSMPQIPPRYYIRNFKIAATGSIVFLLIEPSQTSMTFLYELSDGYDGVWSQDDQAVSIWSDPVDWADEFDFSDSGRFTVFSTVYWPNRGYPVKLKYRDDPDGFPASGDEYFTDITPSHTQPQPFPNFRRFHSVGARDPIPPSAVLPRGSTVAVQALFEDDSTSIDTPTLYFIEDGGNGQLGDSDDVLKRFTLGLRDGSWSAFLTGERDNSFVIQQSLNGIAGTGIRFCYQ